MDKNYKQGKNLAIFDIVLIVATYAVERLICIFCTPSRQLALCLAFAMVFVLALVCATLFVNKNYTYALLASLFGYKMLPPSIPMLVNFSISGDAIYYMVTKLALAFFAILILKFYFMQEKPRKINAVLLLALMFVVPFATEISSYSYNFFIIQTGSMLGYYITQFICYILASIVILLVAYKSSYESMQFALYFECLALFANASRRIGAIVANAIKCQHISRSYYVWLAIYVAVAIMFLIATKKKSKLKINA